MSKEQLQCQKGDSVEGTNMGKWSCLCRVWWLLLLATVLQCTGHIHLAPSMAQDQGSLRVSGCLSHFHREINLPDKHWELWRISGCLIRSLPLINMNIYHCWINTHLLSFHLHHRESPPACLLIFSNEYVTIASGIPTSDSTQDNPVIVAWRQWSTLALSFIKCIRLCLVVFYLPWW